VSAAVLATPSTAELAPPSDALSNAYAIAVAALCKGGDRQSIVDSLTPVMAEHGECPYARLTRPFLVDLAMSAKRRRVGGDEQPEARLADTRIPFHLLRHAGNWGEPLKVFIARNPDDPVSELTSADRSVINRLIPLLSDRDPTRCESSFVLDWSTPHPRVCDLALAIIEYHGRVRFHHDTIFGSYLHQLPDADLKKVTERVDAWWREVKDKSVASGIRAQLAHGRSYPETVWMATTLAKLAEGSETDDREFALQVLRTMIDENPRTHLGAYAADALAELGDTSPVDIFYREWKSWLGRPGLIHDSHIAFYLCKHGTRREWELLQAISVEEIRNRKGPGAGAVWACVVNSGVADTNPYAIPILALALSQTENTGSRSVENGSQAFSYADTSCELLQKQVGIDFGYKRTGTTEERFEAIGKAAIWWEAQGRTKYEFDNIEKQLKKHDSQSSKPPQK
jgi:hypothetical protein